MKRDKLDALFSKYVKLRSGGYCQYDGKYIGIKSRGLHCAHCFSRGRLSVRFNPDNALAICYYHHQYLDHNPMEKLEFFAEKLGQSRFEKLAKLADKTSKDINLDFKEVEQILKERINKLQGKDLSKIRENIERENIQNADDRL